MGIDFWFRLSMNDWHHVSDGKVYRLGGSRFYEERTDLLIGKEGAAGWKDHPATQSALTWMQDFAHEEVRALRRDIALEVCERYDCTGFVFDFIRIPGYFRFGDEQQERPPADADDARDARRPGRDRADQGPGDRLGRAPAPHR